MEQPKLRRCLSVKTMKTAEASEEGSPPPCKLGPNFDPEPFYSCVARGSRKVRSWKHKSEKHLRAPHEGCPSGSAVHNHPDSHLGVFTTTIPTYSRRRPIFLNGVHEDLKDSGG